MQNVKLSHSMALKSLSLNLGLKSFIDLLERYDKKPKIPL